MRLTKDGTKCPYGYCVHCVLEDLGECDGVVEME